MPERPRTECFVCRDWRKGSNEWYTPKPQERRDYHFSEYNRLSHTFCPTCYLSQMKKDGFTKSKIEELLKSIK